MSPENNQFVNDVLNWPGEAATISTIKTIPQVVEEAPAAWAATKQGLKSAWGKLKGLFTKDASQNIKFASPGLVISDKKAGQKLIQHLRDDWKLDPSVKENRDWIKSYTESIHNNYDEVRTNEWRSVKDGKDGPALFYRQGDDVVVTDLEGNFVSILKDGINNKRFEGGQVLDAKK
jgi:hypothetical protein